jgi:4-amino-4-deoxy-L-arabinose transferase-like glycosyltransferase
VALAVRVAALLAVRNIHKPPGTEGGADAIEFNSLALHLASGVGYCLRAGHPTSFRAPGFPLFLGAVYSVSYGNYPLAYLSLCLIGALTCVVTYFIAAQLLSENTARIAGVVAAFYFPHIYFSTIFLSECLFVFIISVALLFQLKHLRTSSLSTILAAGALIGYATLTRPVAMLLVPLVIAVLAWRHWRHLYRAIVPVLALTIVWSVVMLPWVLRNYHVHKKWVLVATNGGSTLYGANNDIVLHNPRYLGAWVPDVGLPHRDWIVAAPDEVTHDQREQTLGKQWIRDHLLQMPLLEFYKIVRLWLPDTLSGNKLYRLLQAIGYLPVFVLMLFGMAECARKPYRTVYWAAVHSLIVMTVISALIYYGFDRFRDANTPALAIYAALGLTVLWRRRIVSLDRSGAPIATHVAMSD